MSPLPEQLTDGRITLHRVGPAWAEPVAAAVQASIEQLSRWQAWAVPDYGVEHATTWVEDRWRAWEAGTDHEFVVTMAGEAGIVGTCGLNRRDPMRAECNLGYWTRSDMTGRGIATAATRLVARFGFEHAGLRRIRLYRLVDNEASGRIAIRAGFHQEGMLRSYEPLHGAWHACVIYSLVSPDEITQTTPG